MGAPRDPQFAPLLAEFGARLSELRLAKGLTQEGLAEVSGVNRITITKIENGKIDPQLSTIHRLAFGMGVTATVLVGGSD